MKAHSKKILQICLWMLVPILLLAAGLALLFYLSDGEQAGRTYDLF